MKSISVCVRARPADQPTPLIRFEHNSVQIRFEQKRGGKHVVNNQQEGVAFKFEAVLDDSSQEEVFEVCAADLVSTAIKGYNCTLLAYGQTGSGKTYTISGDNTNVGSEGRGLCARVIAATFSALREQCMEMS